MQNSPQGRGKIKEIHIRNEWCFKIFVIARLVNASRGNLLYKGRGLLLGKSCDSCL